MNQGRTLVLVDGSALAFRSFYALLTSGMRNQEGMPTWAVFGFFRALFELLEKRRPDMMAVCFDLAAPTFRHVEYEKYKANRSEMPDDLSRQWPLIKRGVEVLGIPIYELAGFEADDIIGTVAKQAGAEELKVLILTGDQDAFQLLDGYIQVLMPGRDGLSTYGRQEVFDKLGIWPEQVADYKGLCGDASDNIPGVKGIGPKSAAQLLSQFQSIEGIYENIDHIKSASLKQKLTEGKDSAFNSKSLATIRLDVPLEFDFDHCCLSLPEIAQVVSFLQEMEFNSILKQLPKTLAPFNQGLPPELDETLLQPRLRQSRAVKVPVGAMVSGAEERQSQAASSGISQQLSLFPATPSSLAAVEPTIVRTQEDLQRLLDDISRHSVLGLTLETDSRNSLEAGIIGYTLAYSQQLELSSSLRLAVRPEESAIQTAYIPVRHLGEEQLDPDYVARSLKEALGSEKIGIVAHNGKFEMNVLSLQDIELKPLVFDPMLASYVCNPDDGHGLKDQAERHLGYTPIEIGELTSAKRKPLFVDQFPVTEAAMRAADRARVALSLSKYYLSKLDDEQSFLLWEMELPLAAVLARMEQAGIALDEEYLRLFSSELFAELARLEGDIHGLAGHPFNINSTQQLQKVLFEELKLPAKGKTKSGYSTDASVLEALKNEHPLIPKILEYRQDSKLRSTYVEALPKLISSRDRRLHGEFSQTTTSTGRLSSLNPNLQNIPIKSELGRRIRRAFVPGSDSRVLLAADYSQIELRLLAHMSQDELLIDAFKQNQDIHARTAMEIFDVSLRDVTPEMRRVGKTLNFALIYQQGAYSTAQSLGISTKEAQGFIEKYFSRYPRVRNFLSSSIEEARAQGYATTLWGRRRYFRNLNDRNDMLRRAEERAACNAPLQGSAADLMKLAMIRLDRELAKNGLKGKLILQVHDELVLEVPHDEVTQTREVVEKAMGLEQPLLVPLKVDVGVGPNWMETK